MHQRKNILFVLMLLVLHTQAQNVRIIDSLISLSKKTFTIVNDKPVGTGWDFLTNQFAENNYVGWGEYHNSPLISLLTTEALKVAAKNKYDAWCIEISPLSAAALETYVYDKQAYQQYRKANEKIQQTTFSQYTLIPFFYSAADSLMLKTAVDNKIKLWGLDHESQLSFHLYINQAYNNLTKAAKAKCKNAYDSAMKYWYMPPVEYMDVLIAASANKKDKEALQEVKKGANIIRNNGRRKFRYQSLVDRTDFLRAHFNTYLKAFQASNKRNPKLFFKMGDNHLAKGFNMEKQQLDMGNMLYEFSKMEGTNFTNIAFVPRMSKDKDGAIMDELDNKDSDYSPYFLKQYDSSKWVVIDMRPFRQFLTREDGTIDEKGYEFIRKYDIVVIAPEVVE
jgi:hypothetical protein